MSRMKEQMPKPRQHPTLPVKGPYYPIEFEVIDSRCVDAVLTPVEKVLLSKMLNQLRATHTTDAMVDYIAKLEEKVTK